ncbi:hypothetical protein KC19_2G182400 [Ceratodon purpureus]|uniref:Uncharacterized protein n=1 Tax=Ceratodon purpureus TaxID=3225 RepID=A0A8T0IZ76_CERPU|nr:hypothetical protein KC19_2G182400 [Ceratodon purpureus]
MFQNSFSWLKRRSSREESVSSPEMVGVRLAVRELDLRGRFAISFKWSESQRRNKGFVILSGLHFRQHVNSTCATDMVLFVPFRCCLDHVSRIILP